MDKLEHKGDVQQWQIDSVTYISDLLDSKATIMDYVLHCVMKSLAGKSKTIQYRIADDINKNEINDATNIFDMTGLCHCNGYCRRWQVQTDQLHQQTWR